MNFYEELNREFKAAGIEGRIVEVPEDLRPTKADFADLEKRIAIRTHENEVMLWESKLLASRTALY